MAGWLQFGLLFLLLAAAYRPLGDYMAWVFRSPRHLRVERWCYRLGRIDPEAGQTWRGYATSLLAFSAVSVLFLYGMLRLQGHLPLSLGHGAVPPALAFNTAVSFTTNTNWQNYSGEQALGYGVQMAGLTVQNFVSAAVGLGGRPRPGARVDPHRVEDRGELLGGSGAGLRSHPAPPRLRLRSAPGLPGGGAEPARASGSDHAVGQHAGDPGRPGRLAGGDQGTGDERWRLLQRQLRPSFREPDAALQSGRDLPVAGDPVLADRDLREAGGGPPPGLRDRPGDAGALGGLGPAPMALRGGGQPGLPGRRGRREPGGQGGPLRRARDLPVRRFDHGDLDGGGQRLHGFPDGVRRRGAPGQHDAVGGLAGRSGLGALRDAGARRPRRLHRRADGRAHARVPRARGSSPAR